MAAEKKGYYSLSEIIHASIEFENDSANFYRAMKTRTADKNTLDLLSLLEEQELGHAAALGKISSHENLATAFIQFPPEIALAMPPAPTGELDFAGWLDLAIEREIRSAEIYESASRGAPAPVKTLLESLAEFERVHERGLKELKLA
ncbi:MAG: hypothetical protein JXD23_17160 [Spirochaetales bacterium]|nr:hypothetical protein [Spirochaetales bacterium]